MIYEHECVCDAPCPAACRIKIYNRCGCSDSAMEFFKSLICKSKETPILAVISSRELDLKVADIKAFMSLFEHTKVEPEQLNQVYTNLKTLMSMTEQFKLLQKQGVSTLGIIDGAVIESLEALIEVIVQNLEQLLITNQKYYYV